MFRWPSIALILISGALCFTASAQEKAPAVAAASPSAPAADQASTKQESNVVVVRISGEPITEKQVLSMIDAIAQNNQMTPDQKKQQSTVLFKGALDNLVTTIVLKNEAKKQNLTVDKAKIDQQMQQYAGRYPSPEEFQKALASNHMTEADLRKNVEESLSMQALLDLGAKDVPATTDADIQKFYESNQDKFAIPAQAHLAQIFLKIEPDSTPEKKAATKKKLEDIRADIEAKKITFADAAVKFSEDTASAPKGGDLGFLSRTGKMKQLEDIVFATSPGGMTSVMDAQNGYHLVQVIELKPEGKESLESAKSKIKQFLDLLAAQTAKQKYVEDLKSKAAVETFMTAEEFGKRHPAQ